MKLPSMFFKTCIWLLFGGFVHKVEVNGNVCECFFCVLQKKDGYAGLEMTWGRVIDRNNPFWGEPSHYASPNSESFWMS